MILDHELLVAMIAEPTIAHSVLEYAVLLLLGGGGVFKAVGKGK